MNKIQKIVLVASLAIIAIGLFDALAAHSGVFGDYESYENGVYTPGWWPLYYANVLILLATISISYFIFSRQDISESIAVFISGFVLFKAGLADVFYFILQGKMLPAELPWLSHGGFIGTVSGILGQQVVTSYSLLISVGVGFVAAYGITYYLEKVN